MSKQKRSILLLVLFFCAIGISYSQKEQFFFTSLNSNNGLSADETTCIFQDQLGYIWIGTTNGINRYDGQNTVIFRHDPRDTFSVSSDHVMDGILGSEGSIWFVTKDGILNRYQHQNNQFTRYKIKSNSITEPPTPNSIIEIDGHIWIALELGLATFNPKTAQFKYWKPSQFSNKDLSNDYNFLYEIIADPSQEKAFWIGSDGGLLHFNEKEQLFKIIKDEKQLHSPNRVPISGLCLDSLENKLWCSSQNYDFYALDLKSQIWQKYSNPQIAKGAIAGQILPKSEDSFWIAGFPYGLGILDKKTGKYRAIDFGFEQAAKIPSYCLFYDRHQALWIGTLEGVKRIDPLNQLFFHKRLLASQGNNPALFFTECFEQIGQQLLVGTSEGDGLYILDSNYQVINTVNTISGPFPWGKSRNIQKVFNLLADGDSLVWMSTEKGLFQYLPQSQKIVVPPFYFEKPPPQVLIPYGLKFDQENNLWGLTLPPWRGMLRINAKRNDYELDDFKTLGLEIYHQVHDFEFGPTDKIWIAGNPCITLYDWRTKTYQIIEPIKVEEEDGLSSPLVYDLVYDDKDRLWIGSEALGIQVYDQNQAQGSQFRSFRVADGLPSDNLYEIEKDKNGIIWIATGGGLCQVNPNEMSFTNFTTREGLIANNLLIRNDAAMEIMEDGKILIGGNGYFSYFYPEKVKNNKLAPEIVFNSFEVLNTDINYSTNLNYTQRINLKHDENFFTFSFAAINYTRPDKNQYCFQLEGFDTDWRCSPNGIATYTNVPPGQYTFMVRAANNDGLWNRAGIAVELQIAYPFWQKAWFIALCLLLFIGLLFVIYKGRVKQIKEKEQLEAAFNRKLMEVEMAALRAQMNPHFIFNSLNSIKTYIIKNEARIASRYLTKFSKLMRFILQNSKQKMVLLENELKALDLYIELESLRFRNKFEYTIKIADKLSPQQISIPPLMLQPFVENAIWHGLMHKKEKGKLEIRIQQKDNLIEFEIQDNGIGRARAQEIKAKTSIKRPSMGLKITQDRLEAISKLYQIDTKVSIIDLYNATNEPAGTQVNISIPLIQGFTYSKSKPASI